MFKKIIRFGGRLDTFREFSNFWPAVIESYRTPDYTAPHKFRSKLAEKAATSEALYASEKFRPDMTQLFPDVERENYRRTILALKNPGDAKKQGGKKSPLPAREDWELRRIQIMRVALWYKFTQHPALQELLLSTQDAELIEAAPWDDYWGEGASGNGQNMLGKLLMELRERLRAPEKQMRVIIAGGRDFTDFELASQKLRALFSIRNPDEVVCGDANGADSLGEFWAIRQAVPVKHFAADWDAHGKAAGFRRNTEMGEYGTHLVAFWDGKSKGTKHMIDIAEKLKAQGRMQDVRVIRIDG